MSLVELLDHIKDSPARDKCLATLYYACKFEGTEGLATSEIKGRLILSRIKNARRLNVSDLMSKATPYTDRLKNDSRKWHLTKSGLAHIEGVLGDKAKKTEVINDISTFNTIISSISDPDVADYLKEALKCYETGALRATVVFVWAGVVRKIQEAAISKGAAACNEQISKHDSKAKKVGNIDDFCYIKDSLLLLAAEGLGIFDKNQRASLEEALKLRNRCGHPGKYKPGEKKVSAYIEDIINTIFKP